MSEILILLILFQIKHYLADFPLQTPYMLGKFGRRAFAPHLHDKFPAPHGWVKPLLLHSLVHSVGTLLITLSYKPDLFFIFSLDLIIHFVMDRIKASPFIWTDNGPSDPTFWNHIGIDQMVHHLTHYLLIYILVTG